MFNKIKNDTHTHSNQLRLHIQVIASQCIIYILESLHDQLLERAPLPPEYIHRKICTQSEL